MLRNLKVLLNQIVCLLQDASGHSNVLKAGKAEELKNARKRRSAQMGCTSGIQMDQTTCQRAFADEFHDEREGKIMVFSKYLPCF